MLKNRSITETLTIYQDNRRFDDLREEMEKKGYVYLGRQKRTLSYSEAKKIKDNYPSVYISAISTLSEFSFIKNRFLVISYKFVKESEDVTLYDGNEEITKDSFSEYDNLINYLIEKGFENKIEAFNQFYFEKNKREYLGIKLITDFTYKYLESILFATYEKVFFEKLKQNQNIKTHTIENVPAYILTDNETNEGYIFTPFILYGIHNESIERSSLLKMNKIKESQITSDFEKLVYEVYLDYLGKLEDISEIKLGFKSVKRYNRMKALANAVKEGKYTNLIWLETTKYGVKENIYFIEKESQSLLIVTDKMIKRISLTEAYDEQVIMSIHHSEKITDKIDNELLPNLIKIEEMFKDKENGKQFAKEIYCALDLRVQI